LRESLKLDFWQHGRMDSRHLKAVVSSGIFFHSRLLSVSQICLDVAAVAVVVDVENTECISTCCQLT
jgi:hypothetical protein